MDDKGPAVSVYPSVFTLKGTKGDFVWMVKQSAYESSFFIFNDNANHYEGINAGENNGEMRIYKPTNRTLGIPTGVDGQGFTSLDQKLTNNKFGKTARGLIHHAIWSIKWHLSKYEFSTVYYSVDPVNNNLLGVGVFKPSIDVREYIVKLIKEIPHNIRYSQFSQLSTQCTPLVYTTVNSVSVMQKERDYYTQFIEHLPVQQWEYDSDSDSDDDGILNSPSPKQDEKHMQTRPMHDNTSLLQTGNKNATNPSVNNPVTLKVIKLDGVFRPPDHTYVLVLFSNVKQYSMDEDKKKQTVTFGFDVNDAIAIALMQRLVNDVSKDHTYTCLVMRINGDGKFTYFDNGQMKPFADNVCKTIEQSLTDIGVPTTIVRDPKLDTIDEIIDAFVERSPTQIASLSPVVNHAPAADNDYTLQLARCLPVKGNILSFMQSNHDINNPQSLKCMISELIHMHNL
jgi:hypothetical protein